MQALLGAAENEELICWKSGIVDTSFYMLEKRCIGIAHGYKGKVVQIHLVFDADRIHLPAYSALANKNVKNRISKLVETVSVQTGKAGKPRKNVRNLSADKEYDADALRNFLTKKGIQPQIPRKRDTEKNGDGQCAGVRHDFKSKGYSHGHGCKENSGGSSCDWEDCLIISACSLLIF